MNPFTKAAYPRNALAGKQMKFDILIPTFSDGYCGFIVNCFEHGDTLSSIAVTIIWWDIKL